MIDELYKAVQGILNKNQLGSLKPEKFDAFTNNGVIKIYNELLIDLKSAIRKSNWHLDGKDLANKSELTQQLVEHYMDATNITKASGVFPFPLNVQYIAPNGVNFGLKQIEKTSYAKFIALQRNIYAAPDECSPICTKVGNGLQVLPTTIGEITIGYLRKPKTSKWTYIAYQGKPVFSPTAGDFEDVDIPYIMFDKLVDIVVDQASMSLRDFNLTQANNQNQNEALQKENIQ